MINIIYHRLFNLKIAHSFYKSGIAEDINIYPTSETSEFLTNGKMLLKYLPTEMTVLYRGVVENPLVEPPKPFIDQGKDFRLTFALNAESKGTFLNITDLDTSARDYEAGKIIYFKNDPASGDKPEIVKHTLLDGLRNSLFTYSFSQANGTGNLDFILLKINDDDTETKVSSGKDTEGVPLPLVITLGQLPNDSYNHSVDARALPFGRYKIKITDEGDEATVIKEELFYIHDELAAQDTLGIIELIYDTANDKAYDSTEEYEIQFETKKTYWKYFIINKNNQIDFTDSETLTIKDEGAASTPYIVNTFAKPVIQPDAGITVNGLETVVFLSDKAIPFYEDPKLDIQLLKNPGGAKLIAHLPNPSISGNVKEDDSKPASEIYVFF